MATQPPRQIPVVVLAGFLGSGKTTLLNHLLRAGHGTRIGAIVNDFGSIEIDAMTVAGQVDSMVSLGNGCLCCAVDTSELDGFLDRLARPAARIDVIVIEASGLAEPEEVIRMVLASENDRIVYGGLVEVVDAAEFGTTRERHPEIDRHVAIADLVVLNKADRTEDDEQRELLDALAGLSPGTPVVCAAYGRIDPELFFDRGTRDERDETQEGFRQLSFEDLCRAGEGTGVTGPGCADVSPEDSDARSDSRADDRHEADGHDSAGCGLHGDGCGGESGHAHHLHAAYESVEFTSQEPMNPRRLIEFLDSRPAGLYRIKGFVHFDVPGNRQKFTLHAVGDFLRFSPGPWERGEERCTQLVLIGSGIDAEALRKELSDCREMAAAGTGTGTDPGTDISSTTSTDFTPDAGADAEARSMWGVLRYVASREE